MIRSYPKIAKGLSFPNALVGNPDEAIIRPPTKTFGGDNYWIASKTINTKKFRPYGWVIEYPKKNLKGKTRNLFRIVLTESQRTGWRIAYLIVRDKTIKRLECHPHSFESFEPIRGKSLLFVAKVPNAASIECFSLDKPVILKKGIWHGVVTTTDECEIKLTENAKVKCVYWPLGFKLPN